ncbi:hypothetical protein QO002_004823 [Pararhizobium capsulatum DSM 1112]|uniref:FecR protein domain-containing protein n=1 Tax=Pararhizobium capsulatum DSM 1112 TaxID=1121113 RepID=A0ABU0BWI6_9HYPH|nr:FecR domain-containing protein [Pararhizobium capsulatum]MDQ0322617.1 hypothetical protein [Pararhizobium capsulatum DSM 1112]
MISRTKMMMLIGAVALTGLPSPLLARSVGVASAVNTAATGTAPSGGVRTLTLGDNIIFNERIKTDSVGLLQILLADGTSFTVGPNSDLTIDRFVYDPDTGNAEVAATMTKGVFRFIGAKTSKFAGGVKLNSPVGTIGIRGAVADFTIPGDGGESRVDMIFGNELTLTAPNGATQRVYEPGYSIVVSGQGGHGGTMNVEKTPKGASTIIQAALTGKPGTSGGSPNKPKNDDAATMAPSNSAMNPNIANPPIPVARPAQAEADAVTQDGSRDVATKNIDEEIDAEEPPPQPLPETVSVRVLTADATYDTDGGVVSDPGEVGLIGGSETADQTVVLDVSATDGTGTHGDLVLPVYAQTDFSEHVISAADGYTIAGVPLSGKVYGGADGFAAYLMAIDGDLTDPLIAIAGTPTKNMNVMRNSDVRTYSFTKDMLQNAAIPFALANALPISDSSASVSDFHVIEPGDAGSIKFLQTSLLISGKGADQVSEIGVNVGEFSDNNGVYTVDFGRRGSVKGSSTEIARTFRGGITTQAGGTGGNEIFGSNGQNFVLGTDSETNDYYNNSSGDFSGGKPFGTLHVFNLEQEQTLSDYLSETASTRLLADKSPLRGFAAGLEQGTRRDETQYTFNSIGRNPDDLYLEFDGSGNALGGELTVGTPGTTLSVAFGKGVKGNTEGGASTYIDDNNFAATNNRSRTRTNLRDIDTAGNVVTEFLPVKSTNNATYFVSGDATSQGSVLPGGKLCDCAFLEWGWWGTQINASSNPDATDPQLRSTVHLGTWVAGDITSNVELGTLAGTTGTYDGKAIGTVLANSSSYIASGDMAMSYDFGARKGSMALSNFDGHNFNASVNGQSGRDATFSGAVSSSANDSFGTINGAFVNDGRKIAQGVAGDFSLGAGDSWSAVGIFGGSRR